jgi:hypothetical protein
MEEKRAGEGAQSALTKSTASALRSDVVGQGKMVLGLQSSARAAAIGLRSAVCGQKKTPERRIDELSVKAVCAGAARFFMLLPQTADRRPQTADRHLYLINH